MFLLYRSSISYKNHKLLFIIHDYHKTVIITHQSFGRYNWKSDPFKASEYTLNISFLQRQYFFLPDIGRRLSLFLTVHLRFTIKPGKYLSLMFRCNSFAGISDTDLRKNLLNIHRYTDTSSCIRILNGVVQNIKDGFLRPFSVMADLNAFIAHCIYFDTFLLCLWNNSGNSASQCFKTGNLSAGRS